MKINHRDEKGEQLPEADFLALAFPKPSLPSPDGFPSPVLDPMSTQPLRLCSWAAVKFWKRFMENGNKCNFIHLCKTGIEPQSAEMRLKKTWKYMCCPSLGPAWKYMCYPSLGPAAIGSYHASVPSRLSSCFFLPVGCLPLPRAFSLYHRPGFLSLGRLT